MRDSVPRLVDIGAGAGFVGLSLKIAWPQLRLTLVDSVRKKADFLEWAVLKLALKDTVVVCRRAEDLLRSGTEDFDVVVERALAPLPKALSFCLPLVKAEGGVFLAYQSGEAVSGEGMRNSLEASGGRLTGRIDYRLPDEERQRNILCFERKAKT